MGLCKVLLYGGCHALVLRDLLATHFGDRVCASLIVNFELIRSGAPFPYEVLPKYDVIIYSPIENKGTYNTNYLVSACRNLGVEMICYPWLEWHGYCPGAVKGQFKDRFQWHYPALTDAAASFGSFQAFFDWAVTHFPDDSTIEDSCERSTAMLRASEARHEMQVRISDFVLQHYRHSRLFLISDHPSLALYVDVLNQILDLLGIDGSDPCARLLRDGEEPQWRCRTPIFPRVAERLDLRFFDTRWIDDDVVPGRCLDLRSYLLLYYHRASVILGPVGPAVIAPLPSRGIEHRVEATTRLVANMVKVPGRHAREEYRLVEVLSAEPMLLERNQIFEIDGNQWRSTWN